MLRVISEHLFKSLFVRLPLASKRMSLEGGALERPVFEPFTLDQASGDFANGHRWPAGVELYDCSKFDL